MRRCDQPPCDHAVHSPARAFGRRLSAAWRLAAAVALGTAAIPGRAEPVDGNEAAAWADAQITGRMDSLIEDANLARRNIGDLAFESDGTIWVAASDGLYSSDGYRWKRFSTADGLPSNFVRSVLVTRDQVLWVGTDKGVGIFADGKFTLLGDEKTLAGVSVRRIVEDPDGTLWFCSDTWPDATVPGGIASLRDGQWRRYGRSEGLDSHVLNYFCDSRNRRFAMCNTGVFHLVNGRWVRTPLDARIVWSMTEHPDKGVMAVANNVIAFLKDDKWGRVASRPGSTRQQLCTTRDGEVLAGGRDSRGLMISRWTGDSFEVVSPHIETTAKAFEVMREAPDGSIWCGSEGVLARWERQGGEWRQFRGLPPPRFVDPAGRVWFVGSGHSVVADGERFKRVEAVTEHAIMDRQGVIWSWSAQQVCRWFQGEVECFDAPQMGLALIQNGVFDGASRPWFCGRDAANGLLAVVRQAGAWRRFPVPTERGYSVAAMTADAASGIWLLLSQQSPKTILVHVTDRGAETRAIEYGGARYGVPGLLADAGGTLWLYGFGGALCSSQPISGAWAPFPGMESNRLLAATVVDDRPWFVIDGLAGGQSGFGVWRGQEWRLVNSEVTGFLTKAADGTVYVGVPGAVAASHRGEIGDTTRLAIPARGEVGGLVRSGRDLWVELEDNRERTTVWRYRPDGVPPATLLQLPPGTMPVGGSLRVEAAGVERWRPRRTNAVFRFSWRIDDGPWSPFGAIPAEGIAVGELDAGVHRIAMRAQDEGLDIDPHPAVAGFIIAPVPLQDRVWFQPLVMAVIGVIGALAVVAAERARKFARANATLRVAQMELQKAHDNLERRVEERTAQLRTQTDARERAEAIITERNRLGRELHDSLEQGLAGVGMHLGAVEMKCDDPQAAKRHLQDAQALLRLAQTEVRRAVNDLQAQALDQHDLTDALRLHVARIDATSAVRLLFRVSGERRRLPAEMEHNLYRIAQEAIANALKHSGGDLIAVDLEFLAQHVVLRVEDNGAGLVPAERHGEEGHFGLLNMKGRARRIGGELTIDGHAGGLKIRVRCPLPAESNPPSLA